MIGHSILRRVESVPESLKWGAGVIYGRWDMDGRNREFDFVFHCQEPMSKEWWGPALEHTAMVNDSSIYIKGMIFAMGSVLFNGASCSSNSDGKWWTVKFRFRNINPRGACLYRKTDIMWHLEDDQS